MKIAKASFFEEVSEPLVLSEAKYQQMKTALKARVDVVEVLDIDAVKRYVLITHGWAHQFGATGADVDRAVRDLCAKIVDVPAEYDEEGNLIQEEVSHYDYKLGDTFPETEGPE